MKKLSVVLILLLSIMMSFASCGGGSSEMSDAVESGTPEMSDAGESGMPEPEQPEGIVEIIDSGYSVEEDGYLHYGVVFHNPTEKDAYESYKVIITAYDENGDVLAIEEDVMNGIQPGETQAYASIVDCRGQTPDKVEFTTESGNRVDPSDDAIQSSDFEISGTDERTDDWYTSITGKVKNNSSSYTNYFGVVVLFKNEGKIVSGSITRIDDLSAGQEKAFEISAVEVPEHDSYEVSAIDLGFLIQ